MCHFKKTIVFALLIFISTHVFSVTEKYRVMFREDPAYSMVIGWNQVSGSPATVYYDVVDHGTDVSKYAFSKTVDRTATYRGMNNTFARLSGLNPKTKYYFIVVDQNSTSNRMWFETLPDNKFERLSIVAGGDSRNNRLPRQRANRLVAKLRPHIVMFGGDMIDRDNDSEWNQWMDDWQLTMAADGRMTPVLATRGNHESGDRTIIDLFDIPTNNGAAYYAISVADDLLRIYTLNTEVSRSGDQYTWLKNDAETKGREAVWRYAQYHRPIVPHQSSKSILTDALSTWAHTFHDEKFQLVVECDAHTVKHTWPIRPSTETGSQDGYIRDDENGTVYIGEGCWGAPLRDDNRLKNWTQSSGRFNSFHIIYVDYFKTETVTVIVDNEEQVGSLTDDTRFTYPTNLNIFTPATGAVITIENKNASKPEINITNLLNGEIFEKAENVKINFTAQDELLGVSKISIYINGELKSEIVPNLGQTEFEYDLQTEMNKQYSIVIVAENANGLKTGATKHISVGLGRIKSTINQLENQGMEYFNPTFNTYSSIINFQVFEIGRVNDQNPYAGLRFTDFYLPKSAKIKNAYLEFTASENGNRIVDFIIRMEKNTENEEFVANASNVTGPISGRTLTDFEIKWRPTNWEKGTKYTTSNLTEIIEEFRSVDNYDPETPLNFIITSVGNGVRRFESFNSDPENAPKLVIEYDFNPIENQTINICQGNEAVLNLGQGNWSQIIWNNDENQNNTEIAVNTSGEYKATVINEEGYKGWVYFNVNVNDNPVVNLGEDVNIKDEKSYTIDAGEHHSYLWNTGETTREITVEQDGLYSVEVSNIHGCKGEDEVNVTFTTTISIDKFNKSHLEIYPNPVANDGIIKISDLTFIGNYKIFNLEGKTISEGKVQNGTIESQIVNSGVYVLYLIDQNRKEHYHKIVK